MKKLIKYLVLIALIIAAILIWTHYRKAKNQPEWRTDKPSTGDIREVVTATGSLNPYVLVSVGTEVSGKIDRIYKDFNDRVRKGELLAKLDTEILQTNLDGAKGDLAKANTAMEEAKLDYDTLAELYKKQMTPEYDLKKALFKYQTAQQNVANAKLTLQRAQKNLDNAYITSPINGVIVSRDVDEGQTVAASMNAPTLFQIANNLDQMQIEANVDEADIGKVKLGLPVEFNVDAYPTQKFSGEVKQIRLNPETDNNVVSYSVIIDAANPDHRLLPGMTTNVTIVIQAKQNVLRIPETATRFKPSKEVWELFGLKWDDELLNAGKNAMLAEMKKAKANAGPTSPNAAQPDSKFRSEDKKQLPDSLKARFTRNRGTTTQGSFSGFSSGTRRIRSSVVWVLQNKIPKAVVVKTGISDGAFVEVLEGMDANAELVTGVNYKDAKQAANNNSPTGPGMGRRF